MFLDALRFHRAGDLVRAEIGYREALKIHKSHFEATHMLAVVGYQTNQIDGSLELFERAKRIGPTTCEFFINYGAALRKAKRFEAAMNAYDKALALQPERYEALVNKAQCFMDLKRKDEAHEFYDRATKANPNETEGWLGLAASAGAQRNWRFRADCFERALAVDPKCITAYVGLGNLHKDKDQLDTALDFFAKALVIEPRSPIARIHRSITLLRMGWLAEGWVDYDGRFWYLDEQIARQPVPPVYWDGEPLQGKSIKVWTEQGVGDALIYGTMLPDLIERGATLTVQCDPRLVPVFQRSYPDARVISHDESLTEAERRHPYDFQCAMGSLGRFLRPGIDTFPKTKGVLKADAARTQDFRRRYGDNPLIGISWRSKADRLGEVKSTTLDDWAAILTQPGLSFVNLQYGEHADEIAAFKSTHGVDIINDPGVDSLKDMDAFFSQVAALDLVISVSNTTVHVAGSLGVETWTLVPHGPGALWYWFLERTDSPWYPSMRLFRQRKLGEWSGVLADVSQALTAWRSARSS